MKTTIIDMRQVYASPVKAAIRGILSSTEASIDLSNVESTSTLYQFRDWLDQKFKVSHNPDEVIQTYNSFSEFYSNSLGYNYSLANIRPTSAQRLASYLINHGVSEEQVPYLSLLQNLVLEIENKKNEVVEQKNKVLNSPQGDFPEDEIHSVLMGKKHYLWHSHFYGDVCGLDVKNIVSKLYELNLIDFEAVELVEICLLMDGFEHTQDDVRRLNDMIRKAGMQWQENYDHNCFSVIKNLEAEYLNKLNLSRESGSLFDPEYMIDHLKNENINSLLFKLGCSKEASLEL